MTAMMTNKIIGESEEMLRIILSYRCRRLDMVLLQPRNSVNLWADV